MEEKKVAQEKVEEKVLAPNEEVKIEEEPYKLYGCDITTTNQTIKEFYKATMSMTAIATLLIGDFDDKGNYIISKEIKRDIVVMDKEIDEEGENFFKAASLYMTKNFYFLVKISQLEEEGKAKAKLFLYEYVGDFLNKEFVISHIANFVDVYDQDFMGKVKKAFNLVEVDKPNNDFETPALAAKMQHMIDQQLQMQELYEVACQIFILRMLKILENYTKGKVIIAEFKALLAKYKGTLSFAKQKALLDKIINSMGGYDNVLKGNPEAASLLKEFVKSFQDIMNAKEDKKIENSSQDKGDKKAAAAGKSGGGAKKAGAKKAGGGGAKKGGAKKSGEKKGGKDDKKKKPGVGVSEKERESFRAAARKLYGLDKKESSDSKEDKEEKIKPHPETKTDLKPEELKKQEEIQSADEFEELTPELSRTGEHVKAAQGEAESPDAAIEQQAVEAQAVAESPEAADKEEDSKKMKEQTNPEEKHQKEEPAANKQPVDEKANEETKYEAESPDAENKTDKKGEKSNEFPEAEVKKIGDKDGRYANSNNRNIKDKEYDEYENVNN